MKNLFVTWETSAQSLSADCEAAAFQIRKTYRFTAQKEKLRSEYLTLWHRWNLIRACLISPSIGLSLTAFSAFGSMLDTVISGDESPFCGQLYWLLPVFCCAFALFVAIVVIVCMQEKRFRRKKRSFEARERELAEAGFLETGVPADAILTDVFVFFGHSRKPLYRIAEMKVFCGEGAVFFADGTVVVKIPLENATVTRVDRRILFVNRTKKKGGVGTYKIRQRTDGLYATKPFFRFAVTDLAEEYEILIPCYDAEKLLTLTGKQVAA